MKKLLFIFLLLSVFSFTSCKPNEEDTLEKRVDTVIDTFLNKHAKSYLNFDEGKIDFHVIEGIRLLEKNFDGYKLEDYLTKEDAKNYANSLDYTIPNNTFKACVIDNAYNMKNLYAEASLEKIVDVNPWSITYVYKACSFYGVNPTLKQNLEDRLNVINPEDYRDADYAGMALIVSSDLSIDKAPLFSLIKDNISDNGIVSFERANACSTSYSVLGLLATGININKEYLSENGNNLIQNLLSYESNSLFKNYLDEDVDLEFATPQAFLALACYKVFCKTSQRVEIFS